MWTRTQRSIKRAVLTLVTRLGPGSGPRGDVRLEPHWRTVVGGPLAGLEFFMPDWGGWSDRIVAGSYEVEMVDILRAYALRGGVLYDIGAHVGFFTCAWLRLGGDEVQAFEPLASNYEVAQEIFSKNGFASRAMLHKIALGDFNGPATLVGSQNDLGASSMAFVDGLGWTDPGPKGSGKSDWPRHRVNVRTLDDFRRRSVAPPPSLMKIDVEGAEFEVLTGARSTIDEYRPPVLCELHGAASAARTTEYLGSQGYELRNLGTTGIVPFGFWVPKAKGSP